MADRDTGGGLFGLAHDVAAACSDGLEEQDGTVTNELHRHGPETNNPGLAAVPEFEGQATYIKGEYRVSLSRCDLSPDEIKAALQRGGIRPSVITVERVEDTDA